MATVDELQIEITSLKQKLEASQQGRAAESAQYQADRANQKQKHSEDLKKVLDEANKVANERNKKQLDSLIAAHTEEIANLKIKFTQEAKEALNAQAERLALEMSRTEAAHASTIATLKQQYETKAAEINSQVINLQEEVIRLGKEVDKANVLSEGRRIALYEARKLVVDLDSVVTKHLNS